MDTAILDTAAPPAAAPPPAASPASTGADAGSGSSSSSAVVDTTADLLQGVPEDLFSGIDGEQGGDVLAPATDDEDLAAPESVEDDPAGETEDEDEDADDDEVKELEAKDGQQAKDDKGQQPEELPEGVTHGKNSSGKPGLFVEEPRWKNIYGNHQLIQKATELMGEPATIDSLTLRNDAFLGQERIYNDLVSGNPETQGALLNHFFDEIARAKQEGEVAVDGAVPLAQTFYSTLRDRSPDGYANLRFTAARDLIGEMFTEAAEKGDDNLRLSAQHFARVVAQVDASVTDPRQVAQLARARGVPFFTKEELPSLKRSGGRDPVQHLREENERLRAERDGNSATSLAAQRGQWNDETNRAVSQTILTDAINPALTAVEKEWSKFPQQFQRLVRDPLHSEVFNAIKGDKQFEGRIRLWKEQALRAPSAQKRAEFGQAIKNAYLNRARLAVEAVKGKIFREAAEFFKERVDQKHERREAAQKRTAPSGANGTVPRSVLPQNLVNQFQNDEYDAATAYRQSRELLGI